MKKSLFITIRLQSYHNWITISDVIVYILETHSTSSSLTKKKTKEKDRMKGRRRKGKRWKGRRRKGKRWKRGEEKKGWKEFVRKERERGERDVEEKLKKKEKEKEKRKKKKNRKWRRRCMKGTALSKNIP